MSIAKGDQCETGVRTERAPTDADEMRVGSLLVAQCNYLLKKNAIWMQIRGSCEVDLALSGFPTTNPLAAIKFWSGRVTVN